MDKQQTDIIGTLELKKHQAKLVEQFSDKILNGTVEQAVDTFRIIFEREPEGLDMQVFHALCELKDDEKRGQTPRIFGVIEGGKK